MVVSRKKSNKKSGVRVLMLETIIKDIKSTNTRAHTRGCALVEASRRKGVSAVVVRAPPVVLLLPPLPLPTAAAAAAAAAAAVDALPAAAAAVAAAVAAANT